MSPRRAVARTLALTAACTALTATPAAAHDVHALAADVDGAARALRQASRLEAGRGVRTGRELTHALRDLALRLPALRGEERRRGEALLARPTDGAGDPFQDGYTVPEAPPYDPPGGHFRIHYVTTTADAPSTEDLDLSGYPDYVETMGAQFETAYEVEHVNLGWRQPLPDSGLGGDSRTDVYIKQIGNQGLFGYAAIDPGQSGSSRYGYLVMDNDYAQSEYPNYPSPIPPMQVTAAHEYNHVLHNTLDASQDFWLFESTAVWMEDQVFDQVNDYVNYLPAPRWVSLSRIPLTRFNATNPSDPLNVKVYGDAVWTYWLSSRYGVDVVRAAWESGGSFAPGAYDTSIRARGGPGFSEELVRFAAAVSEWRTASAGFAESAEIPYPDVVRSGTLTPITPSAQISLDHTAFALYDVPPSADPQITFAGSLPPGTSGGVALVARAGDEATGSVTSGVQPLPAGGRGRVTLSNPGSFTRITAMVINADVSHAGFSQATADWSWSRDAACTTASIAPDTTPPELRLTSRATGASLTGAATAVFSEPVSCVSPQLVRLLDPSGRAVPATVTYDPLTRRLVVDPTRTLLDSLRYRISVGPDVVDNAGNPLAGGVVTFETLRRKPIFLLSVPSGQRAREVARRGLRVTLRSSDRDRVRWSLRVDGPSARAARTLARRAGRLRARGTVRLRVKLSRTGRGALLAGRRVRLKVLARVVDPQRNVARRTRTVTPRP